MTDKPDGWAIAVERIAKEAAERSGFLDLGRLGLADLPPALFDLVHLRELNLGSLWRHRSGEWHQANANIGRNRIAAALSDLGTLPDLRALLLSSTDVDTLAPLQGLLALKSIDCSDTQVRDLAPLQGLPALRSIVCRHTQVSDLAPLQGLPALQSIDCSSTPVRDLAPLKGLPALRSIDCSNTQVSDLAPLQGLPALQSIDCCETPVSDLAPLEGLPALQSINCSVTPVRDLAPLQGLPALQSIVCSNTPVRDLAPLQGLPALQSINCSDTPVSDLAPLAEVTTLKKISCSGTRLSAFPTWCLDAPSLDELILHETRIRGVPQEVLSKSSYDDCLPTVRAHYRDLAEGGVPSSDVKLLVLGNGRIGKTQLCRRLRDLPYDESQDSTHGIVVDSFALTRGTDTDFAKVHLWDFGGQDIYHGTHALFLHTNAVFALVWTPRFESGTLHHGGLTFRNYPLRYWVDYASRLGGHDAAALIVQTRCDSHSDRQTCPVDDTVLRNAFSSGYHDVLQVSARNDRGLLELREKLGEAIAFQRETQGVALIGASRQRVKARIEAMRDEDARRKPADKLHRWLAQDEFRRICAEERLISEPAYLLDYLHDTGVLFYRERLFEDRVILDQSWALEAIYAVFNRETSFKRIRASRGRFKRSDLEYDVWRDYSPDEQNLFIGMMQSCGVCFEIREADFNAGIEAEYIAPDLLPERRGVQTDIDALWHGESHIKEAVYAYDLLHPGLIRSIISRIGSQAGVSAHYWRDGLCVYESATASRALIEQDMDDGWSGRIVLRARGGRAAELLSRLKTLVEGEQRRIGLTPRETPVPDRTDDIRGDAGREDEREAPSLVFGAEPRKTPKYYVSYAWKDARNPDREKEVDRLCIEAEGRGTPIIRDKTAMTFGGRISKFMTALTQGDRLYVFLSDKYLKSEFCMFELFETWRQCRHDEEAFARRVRLFRLDDANIFTPIDRLKCAKYWRRQHDELAAELKDGDPSDLGENDFRRFRLMQNFAHHVGDILALFADTLNPRDFEDFVNHGFDDPPQVQ